MNRNTQTYPFTPEYPPRHVIVTPVHQNPRRTSEKLAFPVDGRIGENVEVEA